MSTRKADQPRVALLQGTLDLLILRTLLFGPQHGQGIARVIEQQSDKTLLVDHGSLYPALQRLEDRRWIRAEWGTSDNNRKARFYELTAKGRKQLAAEAHEWRLMAAARGMQAATEALPSRSRGRVGVLDAKLPGDLVQMDCFHIGALKEARLGAAKTPGVVWQYTAIDVASSFVWAELHTTAHNPSAIHTTALAHRVAADLAAKGWPWKQVSTDRGNEFVDHRFGEALAALGVRHRLIAPGRPQSNGKVEQVQNTILQECWKPAFVSFTEPSITGLRGELDNYLDDYNYHRPHAGKWNQGRTPSQIIIPNTRNQP